MISQTKVGIAITSNPKKAVKRLLEISATVPFYKNIYSKINSLSDKSLSEVLSCFSILDKNDLIHLDSQLYELPASLIALYSETSGTTGSIPLVTPRSSEELRWNSYNHATAYLRHLEVGSDRVAILHPGIMSPFSEASSIALQSIGIPYLRLYPIPDVCDYQKIIRILSDYKITTIMSTPTLISKLLFEKDKLMPNYRWSINKLLLTGENISSEMLLNFNKILSVNNDAARPFVYGSSEAATCMYGLVTGEYIGFLNDFLFEIVPDEKSHYKASDKEITGKLVITWLKNGIRPLVRYNSGDYFSVRLDNKKNQIKFISLGRPTISEIAPKDIIKIENKIFNFGYPVYHFDIEIDHKKKKSNVRILVKDDTKLTVNSAKYIQHIKKSLREFFSYPINVALNPIDHNFYKFSLFTKSKRFYEKNY